MQEGRLPGLQLGRKWLVSERQLIEFLDQEARRQTEQRRRKVPERVQGRMFSRWVRQTVGHKPEDRGRFDKFTERARKALTDAQEEARGFKHNYIGTEHLLLGLLKTEGVSATVLANMHVDPGAVRVRILEMIGAGSDAVAGTIGLTPRAKRSIDLAVDEARRMNHAYIGTEHLLLGLLREEGGIAGRILESLGVSLDSARQETLRVLSAGRSA